MSKHQMNKNNNTREVMEGGIHQRRECLLCYLRQRSALHGGIEGCSALDKVARKGSTTLGSTTPGPSCRTFGFAAAFTFSFNSSPFMAKQTDFKVNVS